jgi:hypothetical protein
MNKSLAKRIIVVTVIAFAAIPLFAKPANRDRDIQGQCGNFYDMPGLNEEHPMGMMSAKTMGYVTSVDKDTIVITDADNKEVQIHVNPLTKIIKQFQEKQFQQKQPGEKGNGPDEKPDDEAPAFGSISDITKGSWIFVTSFDTGTTEIEARCIIIPVAPEK